MSELDFSHDFESYIVASHNSSKYCQRIFSGWQTRFVLELARPDVYKFEFEWLLRENGVGDKMQYFHEETISSAMLHAIELLSIRSYRSNFYFSFVSARKARRRNPAPTEKQFDAIELLAPTLIKSFN